MVYSPFLLKKVGKTLLKTIILSKFAVIMSRIIFYTIFLSTICLVACQQTPSEADGMMADGSDSLATTAKADDSPIVIDVPPLPTVQRDTAALARRAKLVKGELDYYLSRHNVDDEGFDMVARYAEEGDSTLSAFMPKGRTSPLSQLHLRTLPRRGKGIAHDSLGRIIIGKWDADTLVSGIRIDSAGIYAGQLNRHMKAEGHGSYRSVDGAYYEGHWENDLREGFGFSVSTRILQAGIWKKGKFLGERMYYTSDRIYGIDISRYQHEYRRRVHSIDWRNMRIESLGRKAKRPVRGEVDYPVSFVYIKATQGTTITNHYFVNDYTASRRQNIPTGAYHFFSTHMGGRAQAQHYLSKARFTSGDLPPMLDVEPTDKQIAKMGGIQSLFREMREWIKVVEKRTGARPILYLNQRFVKTYLDEAPDLKRDYLVWIARYGAYKPDVHLAIWQLSADGRVKGIGNEVDINVFNGYEGQWQEFLEEECIK